MAKYNCLLIDVDNTVLDFDEAERKALLETLQNFELPTDSGTLEKYHEINAELWGALARGEITRPALQTKRFQRLLQMLEVQKNAEEINSFYMSSLANQADVIPGAEQMLNEAAEVATLVAVSNGGTYIENNRLKISGLNRFFDEIVISEKEGVAKPNPKLFQIALRKLGIEDTSKVLVIGDNLESDIQGGINAGLDTCWVNFSGKSNQTEINPTFEIVRFEDLYPIVMEEDELQNVGLKTRKHQSEGL